MKNILLLVHDDDGQEARLQAALDLVRALDGHLSCIAVTLCPILLGDPYNTGTSEGLALAEERERAEKNKVALEVRLAVEGISWDWNDITGNFAQSVCDAATLSDIIVLNRRLDQLPYPNMHDVASSVLTHARIPVLAVPDGLREMRLDRALVAWDGQASCAATMRACVPLLSLAAAVEIVTICDGSERGEPLEAAQYLSRHGIHATARFIDDGIHPPDHYITEVAGEFKTDYILLGAYSHGRIMEVFGGVTKRMLNNSKWPLVLGH